MLEFYETADPAEIQIVEREEEEKEAHHEDQSFNLEDFLLICGQVMPNFHLRSWQENAIQILPNLLFEEHHPVLIEATVGSGKTLVALAAILAYVQRCTAYSRKALILSPLVSLVHEQYTELVEFTRVMNSGFHKRHHVRVAFRAADDHSTDIRKAQIIIATYEHGRNILADGEMPIYPTSRRLRRSWNDAIGLVVIDEIHNLAGQRGPVISAILGLCEINNIPVLMMTGTAHVHVLESLCETYGDNFTVISNGTDAVCEQVPVRIDSEEMMLQLISNAVVKTLIEGSSGNGWLVFSQKIRDVYPLFKLIMSRIIELLEQLRRGSNMQEKTRALRIMQKFDRASNEKIPDWFQVKPSGACDKGRQRTLEEMGTALSNERRSAWVGWSLGIAYIWRNIGDKYNDATLEKMKSGAVVLIVCTSTLATGVNVAGTRHVAIFDMPTDKAELAQMIGRCGRQQMGFCLILQGDPPTQDEVIKSIPAPLPTARRDLVFWFLLKKTRAPLLDLFHNMTRYSWSLDAWIDFFLKIPFPTLEREKAKDEIILAIKTIVNVARLCEICPDDIIQTTAAAEIIKVCEIDAEMGSILIHLIHNVTIYDPAKLSAAVIPWLPCLLYWISRRNRLPTIIKPVGASRSCTLIQGIVGRNFSGVSIPCEDSSLGTTMLSLCRHKSCIGEPMRHIPDWIMTNIIALAVCETFTVFGVITQWYSYVPRESLPQCIVDTLPYAEALVSAAAKILPSDSPWHFFLDSGCKILEIANDVIYAFEHPRALNIAVQVATGLTPFTIYGEKYLGGSARDMPGLIELFIRQKLVPETWRRGLEILTRQNPKILNLFIPPDWRERIQPITPEGMGKLELTTEEITSD
jgi:hypothetical protein